MKLFIVESPGKVKKIQSMLGNGWTVESSAGHVRDLPAKEMGVAAPDFTPQYEPTERGAEVLRKLSELAAQADEIYLATDPDREGEAIAWHLADALKLSSPKRITYTEITESAVKEAVARPRGIDRDLVTAQAGRRVLDRICGYLVSGPLSQATGNRLSAGRVQSPAVRLVVERERVIRAHQPITHYAVQLRFGDWTADWKPWLDDDEKYFTDEAAAQRVAQVRDLEVAGCRESEYHSSPPAPFTTSELLQAASATLKLNPGKTMRLAQRLFEAGHITYMRTDSSNISGEALAAVRAWCAEHGLAYVSPPRIWPAGDGAQEAHEAIRPTHIEVEEAGGSAEEMALYEMIRLRTIASQMEDAVYAVRTLQLLGDLDGRPVEFTAKGRTLVSAGWRELTRNDQDEEEPEPDNPVPKLTAGQTVVATNGKVLEKKTRPPARYTEASLIRELEKLGIGRPSTYAAIVSMILDRGYVATEQRHLIATELGETVVDNLTGNFSFVDYEFTRVMEASLDAIAQGEGDYRSLVADAYARLQDEVDAFRRKTCVHCPECGSLGLRHLVREADGKNPRFWNFWACDDCKATFADESGKPGSRQEARKESPYKCPKCGRPMYRRQGETKGRRYDFWGCSGYKDGCRAAFPSKPDGTPDMAGSGKEITKPRKEETVKCPGCGKPMHRRIGKKNGKPYDFWGCSGYKDGCRVTLQSRPDGSPDSENRR